MKVFELRNILDKIDDDFDVTFVFTDPRSRGKPGFPDVRTFEGLELCDIGYSDKVMSLTGEERE